MMVDIHEWFNVVCNLTFQNYSHTDHGFSVSYLAFTAFIIYCFSQVSKCGIVEYILNWVKFKSQTALNKKGGTKTSKLKGIAKLDDANDAGTKNSDK